MVCYLCVHRVMLQINAAKRFLKFYYPEKSNFMYLNTIEPAVGAKKNPRRVGRGIGSGRGKTCGKGHKGQHARSGGYHKLGFEGGQMPLQRRLPKFGFRSKKAQFSTEIRLFQLNKISSDKINLEVLRQ